MGKIGRSYIALYYADDEECGWVVMMMSDVEE